MPIFVTQGRYTGEAITGMIQAPEDRSKALKKLAEAAGGRLIGWYLTFGEYDFIAITDLPDAATAASTVLAAASGGRLTDLKTTPAFTGAEAMQAFEKAQGLAAGFKSAGEAKPAPQPRR